MKKGLAIWTGLFMVSQSLVAQQELFDALKERYAIPHGLNTELVIEMDVPGISIPPKTASLEYVKGKPSKITGDGLLFFPKKGMVEEILQLLNEEFHTISLESDEDFQSFKLVSLDPASDWVTADVKIFVKDPRIEEILLTTRGNGDFQISHRYKESPYPIRTEVSFESDRFTLPLKFLGRAEAIPKEIDGKKVKGKVVLTYHNLTVY